MGLAHARQWQKYMYKMTISHTLRNDKNICTKLQHHTCYAMTKIHLQNDNITHATQWQKYMYYCTKCVAHTLTDKRAAHDNGHHLQSDAHTINIRR